MDSVFETRVTLTDVYCDCFGRLKPASVLYLVQEAAGRHCNLLQLDWDTLAGKNLFWAIIRHRVQISRVPLSGQTICLQTWPMPTTRVAYPRSVVAYDEEGNELFRSVSIWVLMDLQKRTMVLPAKSGILVPGVLRGNELPVPASLTPMQLNNLAQRMVCFTDLDCNGHMNNARYLDWVSDLLPASFHRHHLVREMTLGYLSEAREGQLLQLQWQTAEDGTFDLEIRRRDDVQEHRIFCAKIQYDRV